MDKHWIQTEKVYDWITASLQFTKCLTISYRDDVLIDEVCGNFSLANHSRQLLWQSLLTEPITGTIVLNLQQGDLSDLCIFINGKKINGRRGNTFSRTVQNFESLEILRTKDVVIRGKYCLDLNYILPQGKNELPFDCDAYTCFLTDAYCRKTGPESLTFREIGQRKEVPVLLPSGKKIILHEVTLCKEGSLGVKLPNGCLCVCAFSQVEKLLLCAPPGTLIQYEVTSFSCRVQMITKIKHCLCLELLIDICQSVKVTHPATIAVTALECELRPSSHPLR
ncbi:S-Ena type endospore appendage [Halobacillus sp. Cin3]|uniref:S-Ena type endospore appendage n=1 Tax=Halobacillus sp. Cin3 TaxID=2928441 RepID=UPI00248ED404|nr:S-Ena type endospore appendage [Halobacillus sp. Cin3]